MDVTGITPQLKVSSIPFDKLASNPNVSQGDKVKEAARQFEAVLLRQILTEARKTVIKSSANAGSNVSGIYDDMVNDQIADKISSSGAFGLAKSLQTQLVSQTLSSKTATARAASAAAFQPFTPTHK